MSPSVHSLREEGRESSGKVKRNIQEDGDAYDNEIKQVTSKKDNKDAQKLLAQQQTISKRISEQKRNHQS